MVGLIQLKITPLAFDKLHQEFNGVIQFIVISIKNLNSL